MIANSPTTRQSIGQNIVGKVEGGDPQSVVSGYAKKVYVAMRAGHIRRCKTRIYGKGAEMYKGIYKKVHR